MVVHLCITKGSRPHTLHCLSHPISPTVALIHIISTTIHYSFRHDIYWYLDFLDQNGNFQTLGVFILLFWYLVSVLILKVSPIFLAFICYNIQYSLYVTVYIVLVYCRHLKIRHSYCKTIHYWWRFIWRNWRIKKLAKISRHQMTKISNTPTLIQ